MEFTSVYFAYKPVVREISGYIYISPTTGIYPDIPDHKAFDANAVQGIEVPCKSLKLFDTKEDTTTLYIATTNSISIMGSNFKLLIYF